MSTVGDQLMVHYLDAANVTALLTPQNDGSHQRLRALLAEVYASDVLTVQSVDSVTVTAKSFQVPVVEPVAVTGTWEKVLPGSERSLATFEVPMLSTENWIDMALDTTMSIHVSIGQGALNGVTEEDLSGLTQQEFLNKFGVMDLPALMSAAHVTTFAELQAEFPSVHRLTFADPPAFNAGDPATQRTLRLRIAVQFCPTADLEGAIRRIVQARRALDALRAHPDTVDDWSVLTSDAWMAVFPTSAFGPATPITQANASDVLSAAGLVTAFETL